MVHKRRVIVIGGGFAGLQLSRRLDSSLFDVLLIDKLNHHQFQPLMYQVATSQVEPSSISFPFRKVFQHKKNVRVRLAEVGHIDTVANTVATTAGNFAYDYLVIASGCKTNFFGNRNIEQYAYSLKSVYEAISIRNHILQNFEEMISKPESEQAPFYNIVIVGGGPTGVELSGAFAELKNKILPKDYPEIDCRKLQIILVEGTKYTLGAMSDRAKEASMDYLKQMGVQLKMEVFVKDYDGETLTLSDGQQISTRNVIWAAGVTGNIIKGIPEEVTVRGNRIRVDRHNKVVGFSNVYALGDIAYMETPLYPKGHPQLANVAINQAKNLAYNMKAAINGKALRDYEYKDLGSMATVGKNKAVVDLPFLKFKGFVAWLMWMFLHLMLILSVRNRLIIFINWAWNYLSNDTSLRLILRDERYVTGKKTVREDMDLKTP